MRFFIVQPAASLYPAAVFRVLFPRPFMEIPLSSDTNNETNTRTIALRIFSNVHRQHQPLDAALSLDAGWKSLAVRDRAFARLLATHTLRHHGQCSLLIKGCLTHPDQPLNEDIHDILCLGITQILFAGVPAHAAVNSTVDLAPEKFRPLVNAILRRIGRDKMPIPPASANFPGWMMSMLRKDWGDKAEDIAKASTNEAPLDISVKENPEEWATKLEATLLPTGTLRKTKAGLIPDLPGHTEGAWWVQDLAASLPVRLMGNLKGKRIFDLCAAPGGKTAQLASRGANVIAIDRTPKRVALLENTLSRLGLSAETVCADAGLWTTGELADAVLLDAPCSSIGTIRRHPDILHLKQPTDIPHFVTIQAHLLAHAAELVRPGGYLVYCTCSMLKDESELQVARFLENHKDFKRLPVLAGEIGGLAEAITPEGDVRTLPFMMKEAGGIDGFYIARLKKTVSPPTKPA